MDIKKNKNNKKSQKYKIYAALGVFTIAASVYFFASEKYDVGRSELVIDTVQRGNFEVAINAFGVLESKNKELLTAQSNAVVKTVLIKSGGSVEKGSTIVLLSNPELLQELEQAKYQLTQQEAMLQQTIINQKIQVLDQSSKLTELESQRNIAKMRLNAEGPLFESGIISALNYKTNQVNLEQLDQMVKVQEKRISEVGNLHKEESKIARQLIEQQKSVVSAIEDRVQALQVTANFSGVVQRVFVNVGESLNIGAQIAEVGSSKDLVAQLQIPQSQASQLRISQEATIKLQDTDVVGAVTRIEPVVVNNNIMVEVDLHKSLTEGARAQQNIQGRIYIDSVDNALFIKTPINTQPNSYITLFLVDEDTKIGIAKRIQLGRQSGKFTEIKSGAQAGERYILSNLASLSRNKQEILISE